MILLMNFGDKVHPGGTIAMMKALLIISILLTITLHDAASKILQGTNCTVYDESIMNLFNFTQLSERDDNIIVHERTGERVRLRLCSALLTKCAGKDGYSICLSRNKQEIGIGKKNPRLEYDSGRLQFTFTGDTCKPGKNYTVNLVMKCDYSAANNSQPQMIPHNEGDCDFNMIWRTKYACLPEIEKNCSVVDHSGNRYDLSSLKSLSENHITRKGDGDDNSIKFIINVCHNVIVEHGALCHRTSGACLQNATNSSDIRYVNIGDVIDGPFFDGDTLKIKYKTGDMCTDRNPNVLHHTTTISFDCDPAATSTTPDYLSDSEVCDYKFLWKTDAACTEEALRKYALANAGQCTVMNPLSKFVYNLQPLRNQDFNAVFNEIPYRFRICGPVVDGTCESGMGVCSAKNGTALGKANSNLMWEQGGPFLNYTDGDVCGNGQKRYTHIAFVCAAEGAKSGPVIIADRDCHLIVDWHTKLVCEITCITPNGETNLTPLMRSTDNYVVKAHEMEFHINVCRPLVPTHDLKCPRGSAVCKMTRNAKGEYKEGTSLGFLKKNLVQDSNESAVLHYLGGSQCLEKPENNISSTIKFYCDYNTIGQPQYSSSADCHYLFEWKTRLMCGSVVGQWVPPCTIKNLELAHEVDLSLLHQTPVHYVSSEQGLMYNVSICGAAEQCNGSVVCRGTIGYGTSRYVNFDYSRNMIILKFLDGPKCLNSSYTSELRLICNNSIIGSGEPRLFQESNCSAVFEWHTSVACTQQTKESTSPTNTNNDANNSTTVPKYTVDYAGFAIGILFLITIVCGVCFYLSSPVRRANLSSCMINLVSKSSNSRVQYSRVNTTEEARLLLNTSDPTHCQTDSDDELLGA